VNFEDFGSNPFDETIKAVDKDQSSGSSGGLFAGWFGPTKEQKKAQQEFEKWQKQFVERSPDGTVSLPPSYLPSAWACLALFACLTFHALFHLLCHWIVDFKALMLYQPAKRVDDGCYILVTPPANRGKAAMVMLKLVQATKALQLEFQRQTYVYIPSSKLGDNSKQYPNGVFIILACPTNLPLVEYVNASGLSSESEVELVSEKWGKNHLAVHIPSFVELLQLQLLSPLAMFQVSSLPYVVMPL
jgi:hypothetical protein